MTKVPTLLPLYALVHTLPLSLQKITLPGNEWDWQQIIIITQYGIHFDLISCGIGFYS